MQNFIQPGKTLRVAAPYDRLSGQAALIGSQFGVAKKDVLSGVVGEFVTEGVFNLTKTDAQAWVLGDVIYFDAVTKRCDNTVVGPSIGTCTEAVAVTAGLVLGKVKLKEGPAKAPGAAEATVATANATDLATSEALANQLKTQFNSLLVKLRAAGIILP